MFFPLHFVPLLVTIFPCATFSLHFNIYLLHFLIYFLSLLFRSFFILLVLAAFSIFFISLRPIFFLQFLAPHSRSTSLSPLFYLSFSPFNITFPFSFISLLSYPLFSQLSRPLYDFTFSFYFFLLTFSPNFLSQLSHSIFLHTKLVLDYLAETKINFKKFVMKPNHWKSKVKPSQNFYFD